MSLIPTMQVGETLKRAKPSFPLFRRLPPELRLAIWEFASLPDEISYLRLNKKCSHKHHDWLHIYPQPLLHACSESRAVAVQNTIFRLDCGEVDTDLIENNETFRALCGGVTKLLIPYNEDDPVGGAWRALGSNVPLFPRLQQVHVEKVLIYLHGSRTLRKFHDQPSDKPRLLCIRQFEKALSEAEEAGCVYAMYAPVENLYWASRDRWIVLHQPRITSWWRRKAWAWEWQTDLESDTPPRMAVPRFVPVTLLDAPCGLPCTVAWWLIHQVCRLDDFGQDVRDYIIPPAPTARRPYRGLFLLATYLALVIWQLWDGLEPDHRQVSIILTRIGFPTSDPSSPAGAVRWILAVIFLLVRSHDRLSNSTSDRITHEALAKAIYSIIILSL